MNKRRRNNAASSSNTNNTQLNFPPHILNKYKRMVERIQQPTFGVRGNRQLQIEAARRYFPAFFHRTMSNENIRTWINGIKRSANLTNRMASLWNAETIENNWKNNRNLAVNERHLS